MAQFLTSEPKRNPRDQVMAQRFEADGPVGNAQPVEVGIREFVFDKERPMPREIEIRAREGLHARPAPLVFLGLHSADVRFHVGDKRPDAKPCVGLESAGKARAAFGGEPAIDQVRGEEVESVGDANLTSCRRGRKAQWNRGNLAFVGLHAYDFGGAANKGAKPSFCNCSFMSLGILVMRVR